MMKSVDKIYRYSSERQWISLISLLIGFTLLCIKFYAFHITGSQSIFSDALESIVNVIAGVITLFVIIIAAKPPDEDHPYGHGKAESLAASFEGGAITLAGILIIIQSVQTYYHGVALTEIDQGVLLTVLAGIINGLLGLTLKARGKKLHSDALQSSGTHLLSDALTSIGVLVGLLLVKITGVQSFDPLVAVIFGVMLCVSGIKILVRSGNILLDGLDHETLRKIAEVFEKNYRPGVIHIHFTRVIRSGDFHHIDCHMVIPEFWSVGQSHIFSEDFEEAFKNDYPVQAELRIHLDPCRRVYCENCELNDCPIRNAAFTGRKHHNDLDVLISRNEER
jgi:cation diffusion facilitator family transporter